MTKKSSRESVHKPKAKTKLRTPKSISDLTRTLVLFLAGLCVVVAAWIAFMEYAVKTLNNRKEEIVTLLKQEINFPIHFSSIDTRWRGGAILVDVNDVMFDDIAEPVPFLSVKKLTLSTTPFHFLFKKGNIFNRLIFDGMKVLLGWEKNEKLTVLGLEGEPLPSEFDYHALLKALVTQDKIFIKNGEIVWKGPKNIVYQTINGALSWLEPKNFSWVFKGKHQLKINDGQPLPNSNLTLKMDNTLQQFKAIADLDRSTLESTFQMETSVLQANLEIRDLDLFMIHQSIMLDESSPDWARWLVESLEKGVVTRGAFKLWGPMENLDWQGNVDFRQVDLRYAPDWPKIKRAAGKVNVIKDRVDVEVTEGKIQGVQLKKVTAVISKLNEDTYSTVVINGELQGTLEKGLKFLELSPLKETVFARLSPLNPTGSMELQLKLAVPLGAEPRTEKKPVSVLGKLELNDGQVVIEDINLPITEIEGVFNFDEKGVTAENISGGFLDRPLKIEVTPTEVKTATLMSIDFLKEKFSSEYLNYLQGQTNITISFLTDTSEWKIESDLKGVSVDLPAPLGKTAETEMPIKIILPPSEENESKIALTVSGLLDAKWLLEKKDDSWQLKSGHLALGEGKKSEWRAANGLLINGEVSELNVDEWKSFLGKMEEEGSVQQFPVQINILMKKMEAFGLTVKNSSVSYNPSKKSSQWILESPLLKGSLQLPTPKNRQMEFDLDYLKFTGAQTEESEFIDFLKNKDRIPIIFVCRNLIFNNASLGEVSFRLVPTLHGYAIEDLSVHTSISALEAKGEWRLNDGGEATFLQGQIISDNMSHTFSQWGFNSSMKEAKGRIQFNLSWPTSPFDLSLKNTAGQTNIKLRSGRILGVDPGLGKILGLLSVDSLIRRRLQLDFSDVVKKGFVFDTLDGSLHLQGGLAETNNLTIDGPAAKIKLSGATNLKTKELDLQMTVEPKVGSTLPLAAVLATGNPAVGVGVWVVDKIVGSPLSRVTQHRYHVTGTWDAPRMDEQGVQGRRKR